MLMAFRALRNATNELAQGATKGTVTVGHLGQL